MTKMVREYTKYAMITIRAIISQFQDNNTRSLFSASILIHRRDRDDDFYMGDGSTTVTKHYELNGAEIGLICIASMIGLFFVSGWLIIMTNLGRRQWKKVCERCRAWKEGRAMARVDGNIELPDQGQANTHACAAPTNADPFRDENEIGDRAPSVKEAQPVYLIPTRSSNEGPVDLSQPLSAQDV